MGVFDFLRRRKVDPAIRNLATQAALLGNVREGGLSAERTAEDMGTNYIMVHDDDIEQFLMSDAKVNENPTSVALRVLMSPLIRTAYIDKETAEIYKMEVEGELMLLECNMKRRIYQLGGSFMLGAYSKVIRVGFDDAVRARKAQLLKVVPRISRVAVETEQKKQKEQGVLGF